ncbi:MAG: TolC family protein [Puniceicoccaceae bacterium]
MKTPPHRTRVRAARGLLALAALVFAGCAGPGNDSAPPERPAAPLGVSAGALADAAAPPEPGLAPDEAIDLAAAIALAVRGDPILRIAWSRVLRAQGDEKTARADFYPGIVSESGVSREEQGSSRGRSAFEETVYRTALRLSYTVYDFGGGRRSRLEAARRALLAEELRFNREFQDLVLAVQRAYFTVQRGKAELAAANETVGEARETWRATRRLHEAGSATIQEVFQAKARFEETRFRREAASAGLESARARLAGRLGIRVSRDLRTVEPGAVLFDADALGSIDQLLEQAGARRADQLALRAEVEAARAEVEAARAAYLPRLELGGLGEWERLQRDGSEELLDFRAGLVLRWPLFEGFARDAELLRRKARLREAAARLARGDIEVAGEIWTRFHEVRSARRQIESSDARLEAARKSFEFAQRAFDLGKTDLLHLLATQRDLAEARSQVIEANAALAVALAELSNATAMPDETPVPAFRQAPRETNPPNETR